MIRYAAIALGVIVSADLLRFQSPAFERVYERYLGYFMVSCTVQYCTLAMLKLTLLSDSANRSEVSYRTSANPAGKLPLTPPLPDVQNASMVPSTTSLAS